ncbi:poliovirus receptor-like isoform X2 [Stigmatopora argus]
MFGFPLRLTLLLWFGGTSTTRGEVVSFSKVSGEEGQPLISSCNVTMEMGSSVHQVRWLDRRNKILLAYQHRTSIHVSHKAPNVELVSWQKDSSNIAITRVRPEDEGCYRCVFDIFPTGSQEGSTCISVTTRVHQDGNKVAVRGEPATLSCWYSLPERVLQVLWKKKAERGDSITVASYSQSHYNAVTVQDDTCYICEFHTFPDGRRSATACLSVYVLPEVKVAHVTLSSGVTEANCSSQSRPAAEITWRIGANNQSLNTSLVTLYSESERITTVTNTLLLTPGLFSERTVQCVVHHQGLENPLFVSLNGPLVSPVKVIAILLCSVVAFLIAVWLCVYLRGKFFA